MDTAKADENNNKLLSMQRSATFRKRLNGMKNFISNRLKPRSRTRSTDTISGDERTTTKGFPGRRSQTMKSSSRSMDIKVETAPNAYLNGPAINHSSLPQLYKVNSNDFVTEQNFQGILPISNHDVDTWCSQPTLPIQYNSADSVHHNTNTKSINKPPSEDYGSIDNVRTRKKKLMKVGSYSYSVECSSSASDVNKQRSHVESSVRKKSLILRSYSDAQVHTHQSIDILPPMNNLLTRKKTPSEMSYNSLNRSEKKFKFEERKRKTPIAFKFTLESIKKHPSSSPSSISPVSSVPISPSPSSPSAHDLNQLPPIEVNISSQIISQSSIASNEIVSNNKLLRDVKNADQQPIIVELDPKIFELKQLDEKSEHFNATNIVSLPNKQENKEVIETNVNISTPNKQIIKSGFWDEDDFLELDDSFMKNIIETEARNIIKHQTYNYPEVVTWTKKITGNVRDKIRAYTGRSFKIVVNCFIGSLFPSDVDTVSMAMRSINECLTDRFLVCAFQNEHLFASVTVLLTRNFSWKDA